MGRVALDVAHPVAFQVHPDTAAAGAHVAGGGPDRGAFPARLRGRIGVGHGAIIARAARDGDRQGAGPEISTGPVAAAGSHPGTGAQPPAVCDGRGDAADHTGCAGQRLAGGQEKSRAVVSRAA